ncbi:MAG: BamA/TamA family outer membrane protein, partial [Paludibacteraceae bacterium]|nr:BamA/TamA family outer membrane protein [Paludibacteraceae bacterium]
VPQGQLLLNDVKVKVEDNKNIPPSDLMKYVQQKPNTESLGFWKLQLDIYNTASEDTTKWTSKNARKIGEPPVIFSSELTDASQAQLQRAMQNKGYFNAEIDTTVAVKKRKINLVYHVTANEPYMIGQYNVELEHNELAAIANNQRRLITGGSQFDAEVLNQERQRVASAMRRRGYFYFDQELLCYDADSTRGRKQIDVTMRLQEYLQHQSEEYKEKVFRKYHIAHVHFHLDYDPARVPDNEEMFTSSADGYVFTWVGKKLLRDKVLVRNCPIEPGEMYNERAVERAYTRFNQLAPIKYVDISFEQISANELDCHIVLSRGKLNSVSAEIEGTYSAGDWGVAAGVGYVSRNLAHGAEELSVDGRASYEWRQNGGRAIEARAAAELKWPSAVAVNLNYNFQNRPDEYTRSIFGAGLQYQIKQPRIGLNHQFRFVDISYVYLPWISDAFREQFLQSTNILKYSYENHFIVGIGYSGNYTNYQARNPHRSYWNIYYNIETAGNLLRGLAKPCKFAIDSVSGNYMLFNTQFSQFAKADLAVTYNQLLYPGQRLVFHADVGVAVPYGNSQTIPFEKRYFAGGANSVRGWAARTLGPGGYKGNGKLIDFNNQAGDVRLNLNMEYRAKVWSFIELAAFFDAGNIWTIFDYEAQPNGVFRFSEFYKQIALAYGVGLRLDFSFFIFRVDFGVKLYDPALRYDGSGKQWRTVPNGLNWADDMAFHFAIGYPF